MAKKVDLSSCTLAPCIEKLENLRSLHMRGGYWHWDDEEEHGVKWETDQSRMEDVLERTSLEQPAEDRILQNLRSRESPSKKMQGLWLTIYSDSRLLRSELSGLVS